MTGKRRAVPRYLLGAHALLRHWPLRPVLLPITSLRPDQMSSTAQTLMSTNPSGKATSRTVSSLTSEDIPDAFFGHETQMTPFCLIFF